MNDVTTPPRPGTKSAAANPAPAPVKTSLSTRARDRAGDAARSAAESIDANPISVIVGGVALGVIAGMFVPRSQKEAALLLPVGRKVRQGAETAAHAAVEAGKAELATVGISRIGASESMGKLLEGLGKAVASASVAAKESRKRAK